VRIKNSNVHTGKNLKYKIKKRKTGHRKSDLMLMRGAQQSANRSMPGFMPEARFRLPHRPQENGKEINL
jgi:hypothetical protein